MSLLRSAARRLGLGKYRYWKGTDLEGNQFFERPHPEYPDEWRKNKRYIEYAEVRPLSDYNYHTIPVQWSAWLRRTRREPPTVEELQSDLARQLRLRENVARLEEAYRAEKLRLAPAPQAGEGGLPGPATAVGEEVEAGQPHVEGLPLKDGGAGAEAARRAPEIARDLHSVNKGAEQPNHTPEDAARERRDEEHAAALKRREKFAKQNPAPLKENAGVAHQPQGWSPTAPARRR